MLLAFTSPFQAVSGMTQPEGEGLLEWSLLGNISTSSFPVQPRLSLPAALPVVLRAVSSEHSFKILLLPHPTTRDGVGKEERTEVVMALMPSKKNCAASGCVSHESSCLQKTWLLRIFEWALYRTPCSDTLIQGIRKSPANPAVASRYECSTPPFITLSGASSLCQDSRAQWAMTQM